jgi:hypothetical protein
MVLSGSFPMASAAAKLAMVLVLGRFGVQLDGLVGGLLAALLALLLFQWIAMRSSGRPEGRHRAVSAQVARLSEEVCLVGCGSVAGSHPQLQAQLRKLQTVVDAILEGVGRGLVHQRALGELEHLLTSLVPRTLALLQEEESAATVEQVCDQIRLLRARFVASYLRSGPARSLDGRIEMRFAPRAGATMRQGHTVVGWKLG